MNHIYPVFPSVSSHRSQWENDEAGLPVNFESVPREKPRDAYDKLAANFYDKLAENLYVSRDFAKQSLYMAAYGGGDPWVRHLVIAEAIKLSGYLAIGKRLHVGR